MSNPHSHLRTDLAGCAVLWLVVLLVDFSGADVWFTRLYGTAQGFAWRNHWFSNDLIHRGGRALSWLLFAAMVIAMVRPWRAIAGVSKRTRVWWFSCTAFCLMLIPTLKQLSLTSCPWDLHDFGGSARWVSHWAWGIADGGPGRCFPSGHASGAFAFLAGYVALRDAAPRAARAWLGIVLTLGVLFGWGQLMRGAHHLSHTLWTAAICWSVTLLAWHASQQWRCRMTA